MADTRLSGGPLPGNDVAEDELLSCLSASPSVPCHPPPEKAPSDSILRARRVSGPGLRSACPLLCGSGLLLRLPPLEEPELEELGERLAWGTSGLGGLCLGVSGKGNDNSGGGEGGGVGWRS